MKPFRKLDSATAPDGTLLTLFEHDGAFVIRVNGIELMSTRRHHSEDALAELVCAPLREQVDVRALIGGLGLGFTLKAALRLLPLDARVVVAELVPPVIAWNRNPAYGLAHDALNDPRVELFEGDVTDALRQNPAAFDAIMMDVDNGADAFTTASNAWLYQHAGVTLAIAALRERGRLAYWSADDDRHFATMLRHAGLDVTTNRVRAHATTGPTHTLLVAQRRATEEVAGGVRRATADGQGVRRSTTRALE